MGEDDESLDEGGLVLRPLYPQTLSDGTVLLGPGRIAPPELTPDSIDAIAMTPQPLIGQSLDEILEAHNDERVEWIVEDEEYEKEHPYKRRRRNDDEPPPPLSDADIIVYQAAVEMGYTGHAFDSVDDEDDDEHDGEDDVRVDDDAEKADPGDDTGSLDERLAALEEQYPELAEHIPIPQQEVEQAFGFTIGALWGAEFREEIELRLRAIEEYRIKTKRPLSHELAKEHDDLIAYMITLSYEEPSSFDVERERPITRLSMDSIHAIPDSTRRALRLEHELGWTADPDRIRMRDAYNSRVWQAFQKLYYSMFPEEKEHDAQREREASKRLLHAWATVHERRESRRPEYLSTLGACIDALLTKKKEQL